MTVLTAAKVVTGLEVHTPGWVDYDNGLIEGVGAGRPPHADHDLGDALVVPGFVDIHVHGGGGGSFTDLDPGSARRAVHAHRDHGTTTSMASLVTADPDHLGRSVSMVADLVEDGVIAGIHLEGPWISPRRCGAHDPTQLREPDPAEIRRLLTAGRGAISMVTLAPELPGALDAIRQLDAAGVVAALGHTDATYEQTCAGVDAGARVATHLFNAMRPIHHRGPGPVLALLDDPRVTVELIADRSHLHPALYDHVVRTTSSDRIALVTDAMAAAGLGDGSYRLGPMHVAVDDGTAHLMGTTTIAGSTTTMDRLFAAAALGQDAPRRPTADRTGGTTTDNALLRASRQTSANPARAVGWTDVGTLQPGKRADMVVLDPDLRVTGTIRRGIPSTPPSTNDR